MTDGQAHRGAAGDALAAVQAVADRHVPAFLAGERADDDLYAWPVSTWHAATGTTTQISEPPSQARLRAVVPDLRHEDVRVDVHAGGYVIRATVVGTVEGAEVRVHTAVFVTVVDGRITRFDEYADAAQAAPFVDVLRG